MRVSEIFKPMIEVVPAGKKGIATIEHIEVSEVESRFTALRPGEYVPSGRYCRLLINGGTMMSDTRMEQTTNYAVVREARGDVLIAGLGIGMILVPILAKSDVKRVTVIEKHQDVIDLVAPRFIDSRLTIVRADVLEYRPEKGRKWDAIYFDIWPDKCTDNLKQIATLKRRFARAKTPDGWMGAWVEDELRSRRRREQREDSHRRGYWR